MATSSDFVHDFPCTPCSEEDINKEAVVFCVNCSEYFCKSCYRLHNRVAGAADHCIIEENDFKKISKSPKSTCEPFTERCSKHVGNLLDMFCEDHNKILCIACIAFEHRPCNRVSAIQDITDARLTENAIQDVKRDLKQELDKLAKLKQHYLQHKSHLENNKDATLCKVREIRKSINEYLDTIENEIIKDIKEKFTELTDKLKDDLKRTDECLSELDTIKTKLDKSFDVNEWQTFVNVKLAEQYVKEFDLEFRMGEKTRYDLLTIAFKEARPLSEVVSTESLFGIVYAEYNTPQSLVDAEGINVKYESDTKVVDCFDLCQLPDGTIILTDWNNKSIKSLKYDQTYNLSASLSMPNSPWGVCCVNDHEVAVTVPDDFNVYIVSVDQTMMITKSFNVGFKCHGIEHADRRLYIGHHFGSRLTVYDLGGNCLQAISSDHMGNSIFDKPCQLAIVPEKQQILVSDASKGLIITDMAGELVSQFTYPNMTWTYGACKDDRGNVYIEDYFSKEILVIDLHNTSSKVLATLQTHPKAALFDQNTQRLLVASFDSDQLQAFSISYK